MRVECNVCVGIRQPSGDYRAGRPARGFVGVGRKRLLNGTEKFYLLAKTRSTEEKYELNKSTIRSVVRDMVPEGKCSILFNNTAVYVSNANPERLVTLLADIKQIWDDNTMAKAQSMKQLEADCSVSVIESRKRNMHITCREDYPKSEGAFPTSLVDLKICDVGLKSADVRWFALKELVHLDLSGNRLGLMRTYFDWRKFESIRRLTKLRRLNLSDNGFIQFPASFYDALPDSLFALNLSNNKLQILDSKISRFPMLKELILAGNQLTELPEDLCLLNFLNTLDVSRNQLRALPACLFEKRNSRHHSGSCFVKLDISHNPDLMNLQHRRRLLGLYEVNSLLAISAAATLNHGLPTGDDILPRTIEKEMRSWLTRCSRCLLLFPRSDYPDFFQITRLSMGDYAEEYSGPRYLDVEKFHCYKCATSNQRRKRDLLLDPYPQFRS
ncbi:leucine-rich repeat protein 1 [Ditylenchus destructor]|nr:leucine-rich repeat protein 1 [Ditylenchus destructor]